MDTHLLVKRRSYHHNTHAHGQVSWYACANTDLHARDAGLGAGGSFSVVQDYAVGGKKSRFGRRISGLWAGDGGRGGSCKGATILKPNQGPTTRNFTVVLRRSTVS